MKSLGILLSPVFLGLCLGFAYLQKPVPSIVTGILGVGSGITGLMAIEEESDESDE